MTERNDERTNEQDFERLLHRVLTAPQPPAGLQDRLLAQANDAALTAVSAAPAANDGVWRRIATVAACMAATLLLAWRYHPEPNTPLGQEVLRHVYAEARFLDSQDHIALADLNSHLENRFKAQIEASPATDALDVRFVKDCWIASQVAMHMVVSGDTGPVTVMMIPAKVVEHETAINDDRFTGTITPLDHSTLVVLGNRQEPVRKYAAMMADNVKWEY
ncbi:MAG TPA: DUF3379 family protein [Candidatus Acidoferrum sp.]|nr:DUF3379 family protein [Candidatus Acidoferrum sp.]